MFKFEVSGSGILTSVFCILYSVICLLAFGFWLLAFGPWLLTPNPNLLHLLFNLLNPIHHASRRASAQRYKVEPYAVAADIYSAPAHLGRGGLTWYTGAASWLYRAGL